MAQRVDRHYNRLHSLKAEFTESYAGMGMQRSEGGTLLLEKPGRMRWDYSSPAGKVFLLDRKYAWFYKQGDPQVQRIEARKLDDLRSPLRYLLGHAQLEKEMEHLELSPAPSGEYTLTGQPKGQEDRVSAGSIDRDRAKARSRPSRWTRSTAPSRASPLRTSRQMRPLPRTNSTLHRRRECR